jgi:hypothetical protein
MCYIDGQKNKYSVLNECNRMLKYNIQYIVVKYCTYTGVNELTYLDVSIAEYYITRVFIVSSK